MTALLGQGLEGEVKDEIEGSESEGKWKGEGQGEG